MNGNSTIGVLNPFRYRSYYYDTETGLYYLQTRYYDPETCRFLNMDSIDYADSSSIGGLNLYTYCNNDPVNNVDPTGHNPEWWEWLLLGVAAAIIVGAAIVATVATGGTALVACGIALGGAFGGLGSIVGQGLTNGWDNISVGGIAAGMLLGSALGGLSAAAIGSAGVGAGALALANGGSVSSGVAAAGVGLLGVTVLFAKIGMHGEPNSIVNVGGSTGIYDENGNLTSRKDRRGKPHYVDGYGYALPHTHFYEWYLHNGVWRFIKMVLPF